MNRPLAVSFAAAAIFHALLLFAIRLGTPARPLALSDDPSAVDVDLVAAASAPASTEAAAMPEPTPEPVAPAPTPEPVRDTAQPAPEPAPGPAPAAQTQPTFTPPPEQPRSKQRSHPALPGNPGKPSHSHSSTVETMGPIKGTSGISTRARYLSNPKPDYPSEARMAHQEGAVLLSVEVSADGRATEVSLKHSSGYPLLDRAAIEAVREWIFQPAQAAGLPVSSRVDVPVRFSLSDSHR